MTTYRRSARGGKMAESGLGVWVLNQSLRLNSKLVERLSGEWMLTHGRRPNGGGIIFARSFFIATWSYFLFLALRNLLDPARTWAFDFSEFRMQVIDSFPLFGTIFGGAYVGLYARFSSQWTYLANLYNQIKQTETRIVDSNNREAKRRIAEWKAGFIEDAETLHLATKGIFLSVIKAWGDVKAVRTAYEKYTPGGKKKFPLLMSEVLRIYNREESKSANVPPTRTKKATNRKRRSNSSHRTTAATASR